MAEAYDFLEGDDRVRLVKFLEFVQGFLDKIVGTGKDVNSSDLFIPEVQEYVLPAWKEGRADFDRLIGLVNSADDEPLRLHGLAGAQLDLKLRNVAHYVGRYWQVGKDILDKVLRVINTLLNSIVSALGGGAAGEIKDAIADALDDDG